MITSEELAARRAEIAAAPDLRALLTDLRERARPLLERPPAIPEAKALLSMDGGVCADDGTRLRFDPWSPDAHRCPRCARTWSGERHDRSWVRYQHLWLAERAVDLATLAALEGDDAAAARARDLLAAYAERYWRYPNRDNVLGPSRLFFSTYLESIWVCNYLAAAAVLRAGELLDEATARAVHQLADEAATLIGDFDEGFSNRQTWNNAALTAIAVWFEDEELARRAIEGSTGLLAHLGRGYGRDGMWYEGENYHLFALRGLLTACGWARLAGVDVAAEPEPAARLAAALRAPALSALPDFTFPARKDARYGVSLAQPAFLELWEIGLARLVRGEQYAVRGNDLPAWLHALYAQPGPEPELLEAYLHDIDRAPHTAHRARSSLSWWSLLEMLPSLPDVDEPWSPGSVLFEDQGLAILRAGGRCVSLECGPYGGGHGHPDRLHLTLHADGVHWLPDPGTGSYVAPDLFWYRSTLAHNAPRLDGASQAPGDAVAVCFDVQEEWSWVRARFEDLARTVVAGPDYVVDVLELTGSEERLVELPWHLAGRGDVASGGRWEPADLSSPDGFVTRVERFVPSGGGTAYRLSHAAARCELTLHTVFDGALLRAEGPGLPDESGRATFYIARVRARNARMVTVLEVRSGAPVVQEVRSQGDVVTVETRHGSDTHRLAGSEAAPEWIIEASGGTRILRGVRHPEPAFAPLLELEGARPAVAAAFRVHSPPALDGTLDGFEVSEPLQLALEDQYRRSEEPYPGPDELAARAYAGWDDAALYLAVDVSKPELCFRAAAAPPLRLDNEPDDIHSDGVQVYLTGERRRDQWSGPHAGYLVVPDPAGRGLRVSATSDATGDPRSVTGAWRATDSGYRVTLRIAWPDLSVRPHIGARIGFDLIVNEMLPGRMRRAGQLVWSGGNGWVWLRGDRQSPARFGTLELVT
ncbi:MAG: heparinase II/III domain-containing protein [Gemmatimonadales bacterium]